MTRILVIEDERELNLMVCDYLNGAGFLAEGVTDGDSALELIRDHSWDLLLLDIMLPGSDGFDILKAVEGLPVPGVILITARNLETDKLRAFSSGADDYLTKPFSLRELEARIRALLRRMPVQSDRISVIRSGPLELDLHTRRFFLDGEAVELTGFQFDLLQQMARWPGRVFSREELLEGAGSSGSDAFDRTVDVHIKNIRKRLGIHKKLIETVRGSGYRINIRLKDNDNERG